MIVIVSAGRTDGNDKLVDPQQNQISGDEQQQSFAPSNFRNQLGEQSENGDTHQQAPGEGHHEARLLTGGWEEHANHGAEKSCGGGEERDAKPAR